MRLFFTITLIFFSTYSIAQNDCKKLLELINKNTFHMGVGPKLIDHIQKHPNDPADVELAFLPKPQETIAEADFNKRLDEAKKLGLKVKNSRYLKNLGGGFIIGTGTGKQLEQILLSKKINVSGAFLSNEVVARPN